MIRYTNGCLFTTNIAEVSVPDYGCFFTTNISEVSVPDYGCSFTTIISEVSIPGTLTSDMLVVKKQP
jgi:hypothetical protein